MSDQTALARPLVMTLLAIVAGVGMDLFGKLAAGAVSPWQGTLLRWGLGFCLIVPIFLWRRQRPALARPKVHLLRLVLNLVGTTCYFAALQRLPLALVVTIFYAEPLLALPMARALLRERLGLLKVSALALGLAGVILACGARWSDDALGILFALVGATAWAATLVITKAYGRQERVLDLMFWLAGLTALAALPFAMAEWQPLSGMALAGFSLVALCGLANSLLVLSALKQLDALIISGLGYLALPLGILAAVTLLGEQPSGETLVGAATILVSAALLLLSEARFRRLSAV